MLSADASMLTAIIVVLFSLICMCIHICTYIHAYVCILILFILFNKEEYLANILTIWKTEIVNEISSYFLLFCSVVFVHINSSYVCILYTYEWMYLSTDIHTSIWQGFLDRMYVRMCVCDTEKPRSINQDPYCFDQRSVHRLNFKRNLMQCSG